MASLTVIVNPNSGGGRGRGLLPELVPALKLVHPDHQLVETTAPGDATRLAKAAAEAGASAVVAVGGDGTLHEVVNGVMQAAKPVPVGLIPGGRGSDFARGNRIPTALDRALELLSQPPRPLDVGRVALPGKIEYFVNIADAGLGGFTVETANRWRLPIPGNLTYLAASAWGLVKYSGSPMTLTWEDGGRREGTFVVLAVANCPYFGGGMHIAPGAKPDDGLFEVVAIEARGPWYMLRHLKSLYDGTLLSNPAVHTWRCKKITLESSGPIPMDLDGEWAVGMPVTFEVMPGALPFHRP